MYIYVYALLSNNALRFAQRKKKHEKKKRRKNQHSGIFSTQTTTRP